jgi:hypothetical protein
LHSILGRKKAKSIKERKAELENEEHEAEKKAALNKVFRSKPIPHAVLQPRYQAITEANEQKRLRVKQ